MNDYSNDKVVADVVEITPEVARKWLGLNTHNRHLSAQRVTEIANQIRRGEWRLNGESIKLTDDVLLDGQHRLHAIIEASMPVKSLVFYAEDESSLMTIDTGKRRTFADYLTLMGHPQVVISAAITRALFVWRKYGELEPFNKPTPSTSELYALFTKDHDTIKRGVYWVGRVKSRLPYGSTLAFCAILLEAIDFDDAEYFFEHLVTGEGITEDNRGSGIFRFREFLLRNRVGRTKEEIMALTFKSWNAYRQGKKVTLLSWKAGGATPEQFPVPV